MILVFWKYIDTYFVVYLKVKNITINMKRKIESYSTVIDDAMACLAMTTAWLVALPTSE